MKKIYFEDVAELKKNKKKLERTLSIKIEIKENEVFIDGSPENEYNAEKVIEAINFGFSISRASLIKKRDFLFEILNVKDYTQKKDFRRIRGRLIGTNGKALRTLSTLTDCYFEVKDHYVGIMGAPENIQIAQTAMISLISGAKHSNVYSFIERYKPKPVVDLDLKEKE